MKHLFLTVCALLSLNYAFAGVHTFYLYDDPAEPIIVSVVDQDNNSYEVNNVVPYEIEDGATLYFTLNTTAYTVHCVDNISGETITTGLVFDITSDLPEELGFAFGDPLINGILSVPDACNSDVINVKVDGILLTNLKCKDGQLVIPDLTEGVVLQFDSSVPVDWEGNEQPSNTYTRTITKEDMDNGSVVIGGNEVWDENNPDLNKWQRSGKRTITYTNRTIFAEMWNTVCFPFAIDQEQMTTNFGTVVQFESATFSEADGLIIECSYVTTGGMKANTPYLVMPDENKTLMKFNQVTVETNADGKFNPETIAPAGSAVSYVGAIAPEILPANDKSILFVGAHNKVYYPNTDVRLRGFRAYFKVPVGSPAQGRKSRACIVIRDRNEEPTSLNDNMMQTNDVKKYMENGRLVIESNSVRYNAQGFPMD